MTYFFLSVFFCRDIENQQNKKGTREGYSKKYIVDMLLFVECAYVQADRMMR